MNFHEDSSISTIEEALLSDAMRNEGCDRHATTARPEDVVDAKMGVLPVSWSEPTYVQVATCPSAPRRKTLFAKNERGARSLVF